jgi:hypothetical protein
MLPSLGHLEVRNEPLTIAGRERRRRNGGHSLDAGDASRGTKMRQR